MQTQEKPLSVPVHFRDLGHRHVPVVVLVHGWMVSGHVWDRLLPLLDGYRLIVPDLRSRTAPAGLVLDHHLDDLQALCEQLDLRNVRLVGHSMGGQLAALLAARIPGRLKTLTLMNPVPVQGLPLPDALQSLFRDCGGNRESIGRILDMSCPGLDDHGRTALLEDAMAIPPAAISAAFDAWQRGAPAAILEHINLPVTVIATDDPFLPAEFLDGAVVARFPLARCVYLPGPGHYPQVEMPRQTAALLRELLQ